jgi:hypothetical protein
MTPPKDDCLHTHRPGIACCNQVDGRRREDELFARCETFSNRDLLPFHRVEINQLLTAALVRSDRDPMLAGPLEDGLSGSTIFGDTL